MKKNVLSTNGAQSMTPSNQPDKANDLTGARKEIEKRKKDNVASLGNSNGSTGGNITKGGN
ncbi:MAG: hypothetical protein CVU69_05085 [Deltaproteobacteria bacterium HGW-Deltaproteobacteria-4]|nr:MAG: hypothetical protein CVU69_05085 [Deltaproteobacteria bacterium HGW-Deltaproteobacteria-4]